MTLVRAAVVQSGQGMKHRTVGTIRKALDPADEARWLAELADWCRAHRRDPADHHVEIRLRTTTVVHAPPTA